MKPKFIHLFLTLIVMNTHFRQCYGQNELIRPKNTIGTNFLAHISLISVEYERLYFHKPKFFMSALVGVGGNRNLALFASSFSSYWTISNALTVNFGKERAYFELGIGSTTLLNKHIVFGYVYPTIGFRFQPFERYRAYFKVNSQVPFNYSAFQKGGRIESPYDFSLMYVPIGVQVGLAF